MMVIAGLTGCAVTIDNTPLLRCDEARPCSNGRTCIDERCFEATALTDCDAATVRAAPNLAPNGSFEAAPYGWDAYLGATIAPADGGFTGERALEVKGPATVGAFGVNDSPTIVRHAEPGDYCFSAWVRADESRSAVVLQIREYTGDTHLQDHLSLPIVLAPAWQRLVIAVTATGPDAYLNFRVLNQTPVKPNETFLLDAVSVRRRP